MILSIIIVTFNSEKTIERCLSSLKNDHGATDVEIIVIDNASRDRTVTAINNCSLKVHLMINERNVGFASACNQGLRKAKGRYRLLLNPDAYVKGDAIMRSVSFMKRHEKCGVLGGKLLGVSGCPKPSARNFPTPWRLFTMRTGLSKRFGRSPLLRGLDDPLPTEDRARQVDWVPGCFFLISADFLDRAGYLDARYFMYYEEIDLCLRARKMGWQVYYVPEVQIIHEGGISSKSVGEVSTNGRQLVNTNLESEFLFLRTHQGIFAVIFDLILLVGWNGVRLIRCVVTGRSNHEPFEMMRIAFQVAKGTSLGSRPIKRQVNDV